MESKLFDKVLLNEDNKINWKPWTREAYRTIKRGRYHVKLKDGTITYDDFKDRRPFGWGFSDYVDRNIIEYAEW